MQTPTPALSRAVPPGRHVVLYDGVCGICNWLVRFVLRRDPAGLFRFAALQGEFARAALAARGRWEGGRSEGGRSEGGRSEGGRSAAAARLDTVYVIAERDTPRERLLERSAAVLFLCGELGWPWRALRAFGIVPRPLRDWLYDRFAAVRYRVFGVHDTCPVPAPEHRARFLDP